MFRRGLRVSEATTVRSVPEGHGSNRYLHARFEGGDELMLDWLVYVGNADHPSTQDAGGLSALVAGERFVEPLWVELR
jgi:hypothetical protein